jgi:hypothetical protein
LETHASTGAGDGDRAVRIVPWDRLETLRASAFTLAGSLLVASFLLPIGLAAVTDWAWASGIVLAGGAVIAAAVGLLGLYPPVTERTPRVALTGGLFAGIAGIAALSLVASIGIVLVAELALRMSLSRPTGVFVVVALVMATGFALGFLLFGVGARRTDTIPRTVSHLLVLGGVSLLAPVLVELLGLVYPVTTPPWVLFPILGGVALDTLVIGSVLSSGGTQQV